MPDAATAALKLARLAGILPAFFLLEDDVETEVQVDTIDIEAYDDAARLAIATRARLPVTASETAEIVAFRSPEEPQEHIALIIGQRDESVPVVRLHRSEEHTSELQSLMRISYAVFCLKKKIKK